MRPLRFGWPAAKWAGLILWIWNLKKKLPAAAVPVQEQIVYYDPSGRAELELRAPANRMDVVQNRQVVEAPDTQYVRELPGSDPGK